MNDLSNEYSGIQVPAETQLPALEFSEQYVPSMLQSWQFCDPRPTSYSKAVSLSPNEGETTSSSSPSPRSEYYRLMYACLQAAHDLAALQVRPIQDFAVLAASIEALISEKDYALTDIHEEKFDYVQASTDRLRDRLYHVKKEVTYLKRMKRVLIRRLARYGESYSYAPLEIPDNVDIEDPTVKKRKERRERERERKEAQRAARRAQQGGSDEKVHNTESTVMNQQAQPIIDHDQLGAGQESSTSQNS